MPREASETDVIADGGRDSRGTANTPADACTGPGETSGSMETETSPNRQSARIVLLFGILAGVGNYLIVPAASPDQVMLASDVYLAAAEAFLDGEDFYTAAPADRPGFTYLYPPITILLFLPHALLGSQVAAFGVQLVANGLFALALAAVIWRALDRRGVWITDLDRALLVGFTLLSAHSAITVLNGQVTIPLGLAIAIGFDALDRRREYVAGIAFALAALVKVFPALLGLWLLRRRAWRDVGGALATGVGGLLLGAILLGPDLTVTYFEDVLLARYEEETFADRPDPTQTTDGIHRQLAAVGLTGPARTLLAVGILGGVLAVLYRSVEARTERVAGMLGTVIVALLVLPLQPLYFSLLAYPLVLALYLFPPGLARTLLVGGTLLTYLRLSFDMLTGMLAADPVPEALAVAIEAGAQPLFVFVLPPTLGLWLLLGACLIVGRQSRPPS